MSCRFINFCREYSLMAVLLLLFQFFPPKNNVNIAGEWLKDILNQPGGKAAPVISKDGKIVIEKSSNNLSRKQKIMALVDELIEPYDIIGIFLPAHSNLFPQKRKVLL